MVLMKKKLFANYLLLLQCQPSPSTFEKKQAKQKCD